MRIAVLPFNAAEGTKPAYGRQFAAFAAEQLRALANAEINTVSFLTQLPQDETGQQRMAFVNISEKFLAFDQLKELFGQAEVALVQDGFLEQTDDGFKLIVRYHGRESETPLREEEIDFGKPEIFATLQRLIKMLAEMGSIDLPESLSGDTMEFGTTDPDVFLNFLEGYDALNYLQQSNGQVAREFSPQGSIDALLSAVAQDADFEGPYHVLVQICRQCAGLRIGSFEMLDAALVRLTQLLPEEYPAYFALGEIHQGVGSLNKATEYFEKAVSLHPDDPALYSRLGFAQMQIGMPVNAERNFRKAMTLEDESKPSADLLAQVLQQTGRGHEVPPLWKTLIDADPQNAQAHAKYAISLIQVGNREQGERAFENALETLEDKVIVKRYYAPLLSQKGEHDRAMDFYEDVLDVAGSDVGVLVEYAQTLEAGGREFEVPNVLKRILKSEPDPNTRANTMARLIELEQPKRVEAVENARKKMEEGDFQGAVRELRPMKNWLADYWKMWFILAAASNQLQQYQDAEEAARRALELFPACEPAFTELSNSLTGQSKHEEAYQVMRFAASNNPSSLPIHLNFGLAAKRAGHIEEARRLAQQIREALAQDPNRSQIDSILDEMERGGEV
jgi:tetratricopeptide (TPR) repeat protein